MRFDAGSRWRFDSAAWAYRIGHCPLATAQVDAAVCAPADCARGATCCGLVEFARRSCVSCAVAHLAATGSVGRGCLVVAALQRSATARLCSAIAARGRRARHALCAADATTAGRLESRAGIVVAGKKTVFMFDSLQHADSALERFILERAIRAPLVVGSALFWHLHVEVYPKASSCVVWMILYCLPPTNHQRFVLMFRKKTIFKKCLLSIRFCQTAIENGIVDWTLDFVVWQTIFKFASASTSKLFSDIHRC